MMFGIDPLAFKYVMASVTLVALAYVSGWFYLMHFKRSRQLDEAWWQSGHRRRRP